MLKQVVKEQREKRVEGVKDPREEYKQRNRGLLSETCEMESKKESHSRNQKAGNVHKKKKQKILYHVVKGENMGGAVHLLKQKEFDVVHGIRGR